jgi:hypothetical protein
MGGLVLSGPLSAFEVGYVRWLVERGFRPGAVADRLGQFRALSRWLGARGLRSGRRRGRRRRRSAPRAGRGSCLHLDVAGGQDRFDEEPTSGRGPGG